jgi:cation:H+ antiporter
MMWLCLIFGVALMTIGADWVVGGCSRLSRHLHMSSFVVSALVIGVGGNIPEILITIMSAGGKMESSIIPIIVSSNIINILGIIGIVALISPIVIQSATKREIRILLFSSAMLAMMLHDGVLDIAEGLMLFGFFAYYMMGAKSHASRHVVAAPSGDWMRTMMLMVFGILALYSGSEIFMNGLNHAMLHLHLAGGVIGSLIVAPATSGPEIIVSIISIRRKKPQIMVGNMLGSCVSHIVLVAAIAGVLTEPTTDSTDVLLMLLATVIFCVDIGWRKKIGRWNAMIYVALLCLYFATIIV